MVAQMDAEGFGTCTNHYECEAVCPKEISVEWIARLYRDYRARGMTASPPLEALRTWAWLVLRIGRLASPAGRATWIRRAAEAAGRLCGSVRHRSITSPGSSRRGV